MSLPETKQVVEVVEQTAWVLLSVLLLPESVEVEGQFSLSSGQHQDHQTGVQTADVLLHNQEDRGRNTTVLPQNTILQIKAQRYEERVKDLRQRLDVDDVDQSEKEGEPVLNSGHVGEQAALRKHLHHWKKATFLRKTDSCGSS